MEALNIEFNVVMNTCYAIYYENGNGELPFRNNIEPQVDLEQPAFSISYGSPRRIIFKDRPVKSLFTNRFDTLDTYFSVKVILLNQHFLLIDI